MKTERKKQFRKFIDKYGILMGLIILIAIMAFASPVFFTANNLLNILKQVSVIGIVSMGMTLIIISGGIDLSVGSILALSAVVSSLYAQGDMPVLYPVILGILVGASIGAINGIITAKGRIAPFIVTLGMMTAARGLALILSNGMPVAGVSETFITLGRGEILGLPVPILIFLIVFLITSVVLKKTKFGRHVYAIGGNEQAALVSGININRTKIMVYIYGGILTGLAGVLLAARVGAGQPNAAVGYELDAIAAVVIGGVSFSGGIGTAGGTLLGVLIIGVINNSLDLLNVQSYYQQIIKGFIIVAAVLLDRKRVQ